MSVKNSIFFLFILLSFTQISCKKESSGSGSNTSGDLLGKWNAVSARYKFTPSSGNVEDDPYDFSPPVTGNTAEFKSNGTAIECTAGSACETYYFRRENNKIIFSEDVNFTDPYDAQIITLTGNKLELYYKEVEVSFGTYEEWRTYSR